MGLEGDHHASGPQPTGKQLDLLQDTPVPSMHAVEDPDRYHRSPAAPRHLGHTAYDLHITTFTMRTVLCPRSAEESDYAFGPEPVGVLRSGRDAYYRPFGVGEDHIPACGIDP